MIEFSQSLLINLNKKKKMQKKKVEKAKKKRRKNIQFSNIDNIGLYIESIIIISQSNS